MPSETSPSTGQENRFHVVIVGGGFGGLNAARALRRVPVQITLIDRRNFHLFQPLLYQVATGALSPANIATPLRALLKKQSNVSVLLGEVHAIDVANRRLTLDHRDVPYDALVVATGARHHYFGHAEWEQLAPGLKTIEDATSMRRRVLLAFEEAERTQDPQALQSLLTFVIVGAGPTGVELCGALADLARHTLRREFRHIKPESARVLLVEGADRILPTYPPKLSAKALARLTGLGVEVLLHAIVTDVQPDHVTIKRENTTENVATRTVLWAAGVQASPLGKVLADATGAQLDKAGRVIVQPDLTIPNHPEIFVIGDLANCRGADGKTVPGVAPAAMQQGTYAARLIASRLRATTLPPFRYNDRGSMAIIGRAAAVADLGWARFNGPLAWMAWLFLHLLALVQYQNKVLVLTQWAWNYITRNRSARLITETGDGMEEDRAPGRT